MRVPARSPATLSPGAPAGPAVGSCAPVPLPGGFLAWRVVCASEVRRPRLCVSLCVPRGLGCVTVCDCDSVCDSMPLQPPSLGGFDVVEPLGDIRTPASLVRTSKDGCPFCPAGGWGTHFPLTLTLSSAWRTGLFVFLFLLPQMSSWPQLTHHSFRETWGRKQGLLGWGLCPLALGAFRAGPRKASGSTAGCVSTSSQSPSTSLEGPPASFRGRCLVPASYPGREASLLVLRALSSLSSPGQLKSKPELWGACDVSLRSPSLQVIHAATKMPWLHNTVWAPPMGRGCPGWTGWGSRMETCLVGRERGRGSPQGCPSLTGESEPSRAQALRRRTRRIQASVPWAGRRV